MSSPEIYWLDGCNRKEGWVETGGITEWSVYTGDYVEGPGSFHFFQDNHLGQNPKSFSIRKAIEAPVPAQDGKFAFVLGFKVKAKDLGYCGDCYYATNFTIVALNAAGQTIGGVQFYAWFGYPNIRVLGSYNWGDLAVPTMNTWLSIELYITPTGSELYVDKVKVGSTTWTHRNEPPASISIGTYAADYENLETFIDTVYIAANPLLDPKETYPLTITSGGGGVTDPAPGDYVIDAATVVSILATATQEGYVFDHWTLNGVAYDANPLVFLMDASYVAQAVFSSTEPPPDGGEFPWWLLALGVMTVGTIAASQGKRKKKR